MKTVATHDDEINFEDDVDDNDDDDDGFSDVDCFVDVVVVDSVCLWESGGVGAGADCDFAMVSDVSLSPSINLLFVVG